MRNLKSEDIHLHHHHLAIPDTRKNVSMTTDIEIEMRRIIIAVIETTKEIEIEVTIGGNETGMDIIIITEIGIMISKVTPRGSPVKPEVPDQSLLQLQHQQTPMLREPNGELRKRIGKPRAQVTIPDMIRKLSWRKKLSFIIHRG